MKQVSYKLSVEEVLEAVIKQFPDIEDGNWNLEVSFETIQANIPPLIQGQQSGILPGTITRIIGMSLIQTPGRSESSVTVKDGQIQSIPIQGELFNEDPGATQH